MKRKIRIRISNVVRRRRRIDAADLQGHCDDFSGETQLVTRNQASRILDQSGGELGEMIDRILKDSLWGNKEDGK